MVGHDPFLHQIYILKFSKKNWSVKFFMNTKSNSYDTLFIYFIF